MHTPDDGDIDDPIIVEYLAFSEAQARALAELCKRIGYDDCRGLAVSDGEARGMLHALEKVREALEVEGVYVR